MFFRKKVKVEAYDQEHKVPMIKASICTSEKAAGFMDKETGKFEEIMLIRNQEDLELFRKRYAIEGEIEKFY